MIGGERGAERRDDVGEPGLAHRDGVNVALDDDNLAAVVGSFARAMVIEQQRAFVEKCGLRRVEVFRLGPRLHRSPAKGDDAAGAVVDREYHPVAESIVGNRDILAMDEEAGLDHLVGADPLGRERIAQRKALGRGIAERKALLDRGPKAAVGKIAARLGADRLLQVRFEHPRGKGQNLDQARALLVLGGLRIALARHRNARHRGQSLDRLRKANAFGLPQEGEDVAMLPR